jgi:hypothetical protein
MVVASTVTSLRWCEPPAGTCSEGSLPSRAPSVPKRVALDGLGFDEQKLEALVYLRVRLSPFGPVSVDTYGQALIDRLGLDSHRALFGLRAVHG